VSCAAVSPRGHRWSQTLDQAGDPSLPERPGGPLVRQPGLSDLFESRVEPLRGERQQHLAGGQVALLDRVEARLETEWPIRQGSGRLRSRPFGEEAPLPVLDEPLPPVAAVLASASQRRPGPDGAPFAARALLRSSCYDQTHTMKAQQIQLEEALEREGWRIVERAAAPAWWAAEVWTIESVWHPVGRKLWVMFLVDPLLYRHDRQDQPVWAVGLTSVPPDWQERPSGERIGKGHWAESMSTILDQARQLRDVPS
jgi:hypothetical protein